MRVCCCSFKSILILVCFPLLCIAQDLVDVQISESEFLVTDQAISAVDIYLDTTEVGSSQTFDQQGGSVTAEQLRVDNGIYQMQGGELSIARIALGDPTTDRIRATNNGRLLLTTDEPVSLSRLDLQSQAGMLVPVPDDSHLPFDALSSNTNSRITFETTEQPFLLDGDLTLNVEYLGFDPGDLLITFGETSDRVLQSNFSQTGGTVHVSGNLELCVPSYAPMTFFDSSRGVYEAMRYDLSGGELVVEGDVVVGSLGAAPTTFSQSGGTSQIDGSLRVEGQSSMLELFAGTMDVGSLVVSPSMNEGGPSAGGGIQISPAASLVVRDSLVFGPDASFNTIWNTIPEEGPTIRLDGADLSFREEFESFTDMRGVHVIAEGGAEAMNTIEASFYDFGDLPSERLEFGSLQIGGEAPANVRIEDQFLNDWNERNAVYVDKLVLSPGSTLDLNRINLYYDELELGDGAEIVNYSANCNLEDYYPLLNPDDLDCLRPENRDYLLEELGIQIGDLNADGVVDFTDFLVVSENFGKTVDGYQQGDIDVDGTVQFSDFLYISENWGATGATWEFVGEWQVDRENIAASVPEPSGTVYVAFLLIAAACCRRRYRSVS